MPSTVIRWSWEEAFDKYGFGDGDSWNGTDHVYPIIDRMDNYNTHVDSWGIHNYMIMDIIDNETDKSILFSENPETNGWRQDVYDRIKARGGDPKEDYGYLDPRLYLPKHIIDALDEALPEDYETDGSTYPR